MIAQNILFFADRLPPCTGGMEMHAGYFIKYFAHHLQFPLAGVITKNTAGQDCLASKAGGEIISIKQLPDLFNPTLLFFNSGRWIEELRQLREMFPTANLLYRTGGNEIVKAELADKSIAKHTLRQAYWVNTLNDSINLLITNSAYTERRLRELGITCPFVRFVGGVNTAALRLATLSASIPLTIFCAARFVPYKNHALLLAVIHELVFLRGYKLRLRLAGDGPLFAQAKEQVCRDGLTSVVEFLGVLDNKQTCQEIAHAHLYMQLSYDQIIKVPGGAYIHAEGMGRSILEALTAGTFVVAGRSGALSEIITAGRGILLELDNIKQIVNQLEPVLQNIPVPLPLFDDFSWTKIFKGYETVFRNINENIVNHGKMHCK